MSHISRIQSWKWAKPMTLSPTTRQCLGAMAQQLVRASATWRQTISSYREIEPNKILDEIRQHPWYSSIPSPVRETIETGESWGREYRLNIGDRVVDVYFVFFEPSSPELRKTMSKSIQNVSTWLSAIVPYVSASCSNTLNVYLLLTDHKKELPSSPGIVLDEEHVNTAFTTACTKNTEIFLYRKEEWLKVFIHESFHSLGIDFSQIPGDTANQQILQMFRGCDAGMDVRVYEAYTEFWAEIVHILFLVFLSPGSSKKFLNDSLSRKHFPVSKKVVGEHRFSKQHLNLSPGTRKNNSLQKKRMGGHVFNSKWNMLQKEIAIEQAFSVFQCAKLLKFMGIEYADLVESPAHGKKYRENTNGFAYHVLKGLLITHLNEFVEWCVRTCGRYNPGLGVLPFDKTPKHVAEFGRFIESVYLDPEWNAMLHLATKELSTKELSTNAGIDLRKTMRMTAPRYM